MEITMSDKIELTPEYYKTALGIARSIPSAETLRQRMDDIGSSLRQQILEAVAAQGLAQG